MTENITLYWTVGSQPARAVKALLDIGKLPHNSVSIRLAKGETRTPEYLKMNPLGQIPFLVDKDFKIGQSSAILVYLCEKYKQILTTYYGQNVQQRAKVNQYLSWYQSTFRPALFKLILIKEYGFLNQKIEFSQKQIDDARREMFQAVQKFDRYLALQNTKFICGDNPTIADLLIFFELTNFVYYKESHEHYKNVSNWYKNIYNIPEVKKITHQWYPVAENFAEVLSKIEPTLPKL